MQKTYLMPSLYLPAPICRPKRTKIFQLRKKYTRNTRWIETCATFIGLGVPDPALQCVKASIAVRGYSNILRTATV